MRAPGQSRNKSHPELFRHSFPWRSRTRRTFGCCGIMMSQWPWNPLERLAHCLHCGERHLLTLLLQKFGCNETRWHYQWDQWHLHWGLPKLCPKMMHQTNTMNEFRTLTHFQTSSHRFEENQRNHICLTFISLVIFAQWCFENGPTFKSTFWPPLLCTKKVTKLLNAMSKNDQPAWPTKLWCDQRDWFLRCMHWCLFQANSAVVALKQTMPVLSQAQTFSSPEDCACPLHFQS